MPQQMYAFCHHTNVVHYAEKKDDGSYKAYCNRTPEFGFDVVTNNEPRKKRVCGWCAKKKREEESQR